MAEKSGKSVVIAVKDAHSVVALWQWVALVMLMLLVWVSEGLDLPSILFGAQHRPFDVSRACFSCAAILLTGIILVGHTYLQQQRVLRGLVSICCYCKKIRMDRGVWQQIEEYVGRHGDVTFTHGACPKCRDKAMAEVRGDDKAAGPAGTDSG